MNAKQYASWLKQLSVAETRRRKPFTDRALVVFGLRVETITDEAPNPEAAQAAIDVAKRQWSVFMHRPFPEEG